MKILIIGLRTCADDTVYNSIISAIKNGYRLIDTASGYGNEEEIGKALTHCFKENIVKREDMFIITKLNGSESEDSLAAIKRSMTKLQIEYIDLYLVHSPLGKVDFKKKKIVKQIPLYKTWSTLEEAYNQKLIRSIGVSNFNIQLLLDLLSYAKIKPVVNEIEFHPYLQQPHLLKFCLEQEIQIIAYNSLVLGVYAKKIKKDDKDYNLLEESIIKSLSEKYKKSPGQIILNWNLYKGVVIIPKSSNEKRQLENISLFDFEMEKSDLEAIDNLNENKRFLSGENSTWAAFMDFYA